MAAKWQQWMPFHIDRFMGSPTVRALPLEAQMGYLYLLASQWQSEDCTISAETDDLAETSCMGLSLWQVHGERILRKFRIVDNNGRIRNDVCFQEWMVAKKVFDARRQAADRTNTARSPHGHRPQTDTVTERRADTRTGTGTVTNTKEQIPSPKPRKRGSEDGMKHSSDPRHVACKAEILAYYQRMNGGEEPEWDGHEGRTLGMFLKANPKLTEQGMKRLLEHRAESVLNHAERPSVWIRKLKNFLNGPLNEYGKPLNGGSNGKGNGTGFAHSSKTSGNFAEARAALIAMGYKESDGPGDGATGDFIEGYVDPVRK